MKRKCLSAMTLAIATPIWGQSINIDFGSPGAGPPATYAAAGQPGFWNSIEAEHTPIQNPQFIYPLRGLDGDFTGVTLHQFGGQDLILANDPALSGNDAILLNDAVVTHSQNLETCLYIDGLQPGYYEVITYAWMPNFPNQLGMVRLDFDPIVVPVGGVWAGQHELGVTYARHIYHVTGNLFMGGHVGNAQGADLAIGAAMNGIQLKHLDDCQTVSIVDGEPGTSFSQVAFDGYVDPRIESSDGINVDLGIDRITLRFTGPVVDANGNTLTAQSFAVEQTGGQSPPAITDVETDDNQTVTLHFDRAISLQQWTTVSTTAVSECTGSPIVGPNNMRVGYLPSDVDQNGSVNPLDLLRFKQYVNGVSAPDFGVIADYIDTDRDAMVSPLDLLTFKQLINGISPPATQSWAGAALP